MPNKAIPPIEEYRLCEEKARHLEGYIWQTAALLGIGSAVTLVSAASNPPTADGIVTGIAAILGVTFSLVWWRFARRWWSIQYLLFQRMETLDKKHGSRMAQIVRDVDDAAQRDRLHLRDEGTRMQRLLSKYLDLSDVDVPKEDRGTRPHEYRGMREAARFLVWVLVGAWALLYGRAMFVSGDWLILSVVGVAYLGLLAWLWRRK